MAKTDLRTKLEEVAIELFSAGTVEAEHLATRIRNYLRGRQDDAIANRRLEIARKKHESLKADRQ